MRSLPQLEPGAPSTTSSSRRRLFRIGSISFLTNAVLAAVFFILLIALNPPSDTAGLLGFIESMKQAYISVLAFLLIQGLFIVPAVLVVYPALKDVSRSIVLVVVLLGALGVVFHFVSVLSSFSLIGLSDGYASASSPSAQASYLASAVGVQGFDNLATAIDTLFLSLFTLLASWLMVKSAAFGRLAAYPGMTSGAVGVLITVLPALDVQGLVSVVVGILQIIWLAIVGVKLWRLK